MDKSYTNTMKGIAIIGIMIHHIGQYIGYDGNIFTRISCLFGSVFAGLFLFISGYGNAKSYMSIEKGNFKDKILWLCKRIMRIVIDFIVIASMFFVISYFMGRPFGYLNTIKYIFTLTLPGWICWYMKVQLLLYVFLFVSFFFERFSLQMKSLLLFMISCLFIVCLYFMKVASFWYDTCICFTLGVYIATISDKIQILKYWLKILLSIMLCVTFIIAVFLNIKGVPFMGFAQVIVFCITCVFFCTIIPFKGKFMIQIGERSCEIYFIHLVIIELFREGIITVNIEIGIVFVVVLSIILSYIIHTIVSAIQGKLLSLISRRLA